MDKLYTTQEVAEILKVSDRTVRNLIKREDLKAIKVGRKWRIKEKFLQEYLKEDK